MFVVVGEKLLNQLTLTAHIKSLSICQINISIDLKENNEAATFEHFHEAWTGKSEVKGLSEWIEFDVQPSRTYEPVFEIFYWQYWIFINATILKIGKLERIIMSIGL